MSDESDDESQENMHGLPKDFNINATIPTLSEQLKKTPLTEGFYDYILRLETEKAETDGRMCVTLLFRYLLLLCISLVIIDIEMISLLFYTICLFSNSNKS